MAEGDTIVRAARRIERAVLGEFLAVAANNPRGRAAGVERLNGRRLDRVETRGKHLLLGFDDLILHSHLGMGGSWHTYRRGERWGKPRSAAWATLRGEEGEAVQFGGPTLKLIDRAQARRLLEELGPDILATEFDAGAAAGSLLHAGDRELGEALLDQRLIAGIGNIFKSETCFAARTSPWRRVGKHSEGELRTILEAARRLMVESVASGRPARGVYRRAGRPCPACGTAISSRGQGDANRVTYWCPRCQTGESRAK